MAHSQTEQWLWMPIISTAQADGDFPVSGRMMAPAIAETLTGELLEPPHMIRVLFFKAV